MFTAAHQHSVNGSSKTLKQLVSFTFLIATIVSVSLSLALYTVANCREKTTFKNQKLISFTYFGEIHWHKKQRSMNQRGFVDISNQLMLC